MTRKQEVTRKGKGEGSGKGWREREKKRSFKVEHGWLVKRCNGGQPLNILYF